MGGVRILVQMCSVPQPEEVNAMSPGTQLLLSLLRSSAPVFGKAHCASDFAVHGILILLETRL